MAPENSDMAPLVRITVPARVGQPLSRPQQEFNRLAARIAGLEQELHAFRAAATELRRLVQDEYRPLQARHNAQRAALVRVLDHAFGSYKLSRTERGKIAFVLGHRSQDLLRKGFPDLQATLARYAPAPPSAATVQAQADARQQEYRARYGIRFDPAADLRTPAQVEAYVQAQLAQAEAAYQAEQQARAARRAARKPSPRRQAAAEQQQAEARSSTKAVRTLYLDLVKHLHPDTEPDPAEQLRKTELLKQVTTAYEAGELLTLLRLQLELNRVDPAHLASLAEHQLRYYTALLREQARELHEALGREQQLLAHFTGRPVPPGRSPAATRADYEQQKRQLLARTEQLRAEVQAFEQDPAALKAWLKAIEVAAPGQ